MKSTELLDKVNDRESFLAFAEALVQERRQAEKIEAADPEGFKWGGALGWTNTSISSFIEGGLSQFDPERHEKPIESPTWKDLAYFLYLGQFIE